MMDEISRCIADGHRGNGTAEGDVCCQVCQEIQCDPDCAVEVSRVKVEQARADEREACIDIVLGVSGWGERYAAASAIRARGEASA